IRFRDHHGVGNSLGTFFFTLFPLVGCVTLVSFLATWAYLRTVLRHADRSGAQLVPDRVRGTLNAVPEGILVLDREQRIALVNDPFAAKFGTPPAQLKGLKASDLPWKHGRGNTAPKRYPWLRSLEEGVSQFGTVLGLVTAQGRVRKLSINSAPIC